MLADVMVLKDSFELGVTVGINVTHVITAFRRTEMQFIL